jgi:hypothetical protein
MGAKLRDILRYDRAVPFPRPTRERAADALADAGEGRSDEEFLEIPLTFILSSSPEIGGEEKRGT